MLMFLRNSCSNSIIFTAVRTLSCFLEKRKDYVVKRPIVNNWKNHLGLGDSESDQFCVLKDFNLSSLTVYLLTVHIRLYNTGMGYIYIYIY